MNILQLQDNLKNFSQDQLVNEMKQPSGQVPQFLVLSELNRRKKMESDFAMQQGQQGQSTVAEEAIAAAGVPQGGLQSMAQSMAPKSNIAQNTGVAPTPGMEEGGLVGGRILPYSSYSRSGGYRDEFGRVLADADAEDVSDLPIALQLGMAARDEITRPSSFTERVTGPSQWSPPGAARPHLPPRAGTPPDVYDPTSRMGFDPSTGTEYPMTGPGFGRATFDPAAVVGGVGPEMPGGFDPPPLGLGALAQLQPGPGGAQPGLLPQAPAAGAPVINVSDAPAGPADEWGMGSVPYPDLIDLPLSEWNKAPVGPMTPVSRETSSGSAGRGERRGQAPTMTLADILGLEAAEGGSGRNRRGREMRDERIAEEQAGNIEDLDVTIPPYLQRGEIPPEAPEGSPASDEATSDTMTSKPPGGGSGRTSVSAGGAVSSPSYGKAEELLAQRMDELEEAEAQNKAMALAQFGLALMSGDTGSFGKDVGRAGIAALQQMREGQGEISAREQSLQDAQISLAMERENMAFQARLAAAKAAASRSGASALDPLDLMKLNLDIGEAAGRIASEMKTIEDELTGTANPALEERHQNLQLQLYKLRQQQNAVEGLLGMTPNVGDQPQPAGG